MLHTSTRGASVGIAATEAKTAIKGGILIYHEAAKMYEATAREIGDLAREAIDELGPEVAKEAAIEVGADLAEEAL